MGSPTHVPPSDAEKSALVEQIIRGELSPEDAQRRHGLSRAQLKEWVRVYRREARRAFDDRVKSVLSTQGIDMDELSGAEFSGNVEDMSVGDLLQTIQLGAKDAEIRIEQGGRLSHIWCIGGDVVDAQASELRGAAAAYRILGFQRGRVHADFSPVERPRRIDVSTAALLMEGARRFDECRQLRTKIGDMDAVYVPSDRSLAPDVQATPDQFAVLRLFDGFRSCEDVVSVSAAPDLETLTSIQALHAGGLLERVRPSRTLLREIPVTIVASDAPPEQSFSPIAQTLGAEPSRSQRWVWGLAALGSATLGSVLALRVADERDARQQPALAPRPAAPSARVPAVSFSVPGSPGARHSPPREQGVKGERSQAERVQPEPVADKAPVAPPACPEGAVLVAPESAGPGSAGADSAAPDPHAPERAIAAFCLARTEVTVKDYARCRERGACGALATGADPPDARLSPDLRSHARAVYASQCNAGQPGRDRHPINCVTFQHAHEYCVAAGGRLPSEAEWEAAAHGSAGRAYPWGDAAPDATRLNACGAECKAWYGELGLDSLFEGVMYDGDDGFAGTAPVGSYAPGVTPDGIYDLFGNVAEWTSTVVDAGPGRAAAPAASTLVVRGGSFSSGLDGERRPAERVVLGAEAQGRGVGFRCAFDPKPRR